MLGISIPGSDERTNLRGRDRVGGWFIRAGDGFRMYVNDSRNMGASYIADMTVMRPGAPLDARGGQLPGRGRRRSSSLFLQPSSG